MRKNEQSPVLQLQFMSIICRHRMIANDIFSIQFFVGRLSNLFIKHSLRKANSCTVLIFLKKHKDSVFYNCSKKCSVLEIPNHFHVIN